ncbi:MAG: hypothetical protein GEU73_13980 [Chloroflexi bacterium]|nr:hypothetical protein [Chloroflexota bacterium]
MIREIADRRADIEALCRRYKVQRLEVFGSAAVGDIRPGESDLDFLVEFRAPGTGYADRFFALLEGLQELLERLGWTYVPREVLLKGRVVLPPTQAEAPA